VTEIQEGMLLCCRLNIKSIRHAKPNKQMSRAQALAKNTKNPSKLFVDVKCGDGEFRIYDTSKKADGYRGEKPVDTIKLAVLDFDLFTITGFDEDKNLGLYSNEVRTINDILKVRYNGKDNKVIYEGPYNKEAIKAIEGNYTRCVYGMMPNGDIAHFKISGAALGPWIKEIENGSDKATTHWIEVEDWVDKKKGRVDYKEPQFKFTTKLSQKELDKAEELYTVVQNYLTGYLANGGPAPKKDGIPSDVLEEVEEDDESEKIVDTDEWKSYKFKKQELYEMDYSDLLDAKNDFESNDDVESENYQFICRAVKEHQDALKTWKKQATDKGTVLGDCDLDKLKKLHSWIEDNRPNHKIKIFMQAGIRELSQGSEEEEDDIPF